MLVLAAMHRTLLSWCLHIVFSLLACCRQQCPLEMLPEWFRYIRSGLDVWFRLRCLPWCFSLHVQTKMQLLSSWVSRERVWTIHTLDQRWANRHRGRMWPNELFNPACRAFTIISPEAKLRRLSAWLVRKKKVGPKHHPPSLVVNRIVNFQALFLSNVKHDF